MVPSRAGLAGFGLAFAAMTIVALALVARFELDREGALHREVITGLAVKDSLEALRVQLNDLRLNARLAGATGDIEALQQVERRAVEVDAELDYLSQHAALDQPDERFRALADAARLLVVNARSAAMRQRLPGQVGWAELERSGAAATGALERLLEWQTSRINERTLTQIRIGDALRGYVSWVLAGSIVVLLGLFGIYGWAKMREERARARIEYLAHHDTITGLPNRALFEDRLGQAIARARRSSKGFALLIFDLDGFKALNDTRGHAAGDLALKQVAERSRAGLRASDTVARIGGDEFAAILADATREGAAAAAEKLRAALAAPYSIGGAPAPLSASIGMSLFPEHGEDGEALQRAADAALYEAKRSGRNRVCVARGREAVALSAVR